MSLIKPDVVRDSVKVPEIELKKTGKIVELEGKKKIMDANDAYNLFLDIWNKNLITAQEETYVIFFNNNNKPIGYYHHSRGGITATVQDIQVLSAMAVKSLAKGVIVAHNHPSGNLKPSNEDISTSRKIKEAFKLFNITLMDAIIITEDGFYSLQQEGQL